MPREQVQSDLLESIDKFMATFSESIAAMKDNVQLAKPERRYSIVDNSPAAIMKAASHLETVEQLECTYISDILVVGAVTDLLFS